MIMAKILVATDKPFAAIAVKGIREVVEGAGDELILLEKYGEKAKLLEAVKDVDAIIIRSDVIDAEVLDAAKQLKIVVRAGAGYDNVDLAAATAHGVVVMNTPGQNSNAVAELVFGMLVFAVRNFYNGKAGTELKGKKLGLAYSSKLGQYIITEKDENGIRIADEIKPAKPTMRSVISIDENGENVERKSPHALMKTNRKDIEMSITIDIYGYIELGKVRVTPCNERVERPVKVQSKTNVPETEVIKATDTRTENHEIAHNFEKGEEKGIEIQNLNMIIDLGNGETTTIAKEAEKAKVSPEEFLNLYNEAEGKTPKEKIDNAHEEVEEQFRGNERRR